jgi:uncharacterized protein YodC (DUF2158 family)
MKPGAVVRLASEGPWMTIEQIDRSNPDSPLANCVWFAKRGDKWEFYNGCFALATLEVKP